MIFFGIVLWVLLVSPVNIVLKTVFNRFWSSCGFQNLQKPLVFVGQIEDARFCAVISLGVAIRSILAPFWVAKSDQNRFWEGSEIDPKYNRKKFGVWDRSLNDLWTILAPNLGARGVQGFRFSRSIRLSGPLWDPNSPPAPSEIEFSQFWVDFGTIFD